MSGWSQQIAGEHVPPTGVVGIIVAQKFPDPELIRVTLEDGFARVAPDTVWVLREAERKGHAVNYAWQTFKSNGITPLLAPLNPAWQAKDEEHGYDLRANYRDIEIRATCERIIVFHDKSSNVTADWIDYRDNGLSQAKIYVVERGKVKVKKYKKGRKID